MPFINHCPVCGRNLTRPRSLINHIWSIHGAALFPRHPGISRPHGDPTPEQEAACPSCEYHCPIDDEQSLIQHFSDEHGVELEPLLQRNRPTRTEGPSRVVMTDSSRSASSARARRRLPSPTNPTSSADELDEDVGSVVDTIIAGFNKFLSIVGRSQ